MKRTDNKGFTIVELMIATVVFSVLLLVITGAIIQIGKLYYKGITAARTQAVARATIDDLSQAIQFNSGVFNGPINGGDKGSAFCVGNRLYEYKQAQQRKDDLHSLLVRQVGGGCGGIGSNEVQDLRVPNGLSGTELMGENMRLAKLAITNVDAKTYNITVRVLFGDNDLLCTENPYPGVAAADCSSPDSMSQTEIEAREDLRCKAIRSGGQFCAVSELTTTVERRLQP